MHWARKLPNDADSAYIDTRLESIGVQIASRVPVSIHKFRWWISTKYEARYVDRSWFELFVCVSELSTTELASFVLRDDVDFDLWVQAIPGNDARGRLHRDDTVLDVWGRP